MGSECEECEGLRDAMGKGGAARVSARIMAASDAVRGRPNTPKRKFSTWRDRKNRQLLATCASRFAGAVHTLLVAPVARQYARCCRRRSALTHSTSVARASHALPRRPCARRPAARWAVPRRTPAACVRAATRCTPVRAAAGAGAAVTASAPRLLPTRAWAVPQSWEEPSDAPNENTFYAPRRFQNFFL